MSQTTPTRNNKNSMKGLAYWEKYASKYDLSLGLIGRPFKRMLELIGEAAEGAEQVLEVAAGTGLVTPTLADKADNVVATDYADAMLERLKAKVAEHGLSNVQCEQADIYELRYESHSFDLVVAANVLHIVPDLPAALDALKLMLKPGGRLIVPTFCHDETRTSRFMSRLLAITSFPGQRRLTVSSLADFLIKGGLVLAHTETLPGLIPIGYAEGVFQ